MWEQDWALLGIEPTTELGAIKKAYALKLRVTRPDDDAQAYQALRGAYERVQQWVKWSAEAPAPEASVSAEHVPAPEVPAEVPPAPPAADELMLLAAHAAPATLIDEAEAIWNEQGNAALLAHWPRLREQLDALPLSAAAQVSQAFAEWTLQHPAMPSAMLAHFESYFGWRDDYRSEQQLDPDLALALHALLDEVRPRLLNDPDLLGRAAPLFSLDALNARPATRWKAWIAGAASAQTLARIKAGLGEHLLARLGLEPTAQKSLDFLLLTGLALRWAPLLLLITIGLFIAKSDLQSASMAAVAVALSVMAWRGVSGILGACLQHGLGVLDRAGSDAPPPGAPLPGRTRLGLGLFAAGAMFGAVGSDWPSHAGDVLGHLCIAAGLLVGHWALTADRSRALAASLIAALFVFHALFGGLLAPAAWVGLACLWTGISSLAFEDRLRSRFNGPAAAIGRPIGNTLAVSDRWGSSLASWVPLLVALGSTTLDGPSRVLIVWGCWSLASYLLVKAQTALDESVLRWLARTAPH